MRICEVIQLLDPESGTVITERRFTVEDFPGAAPRVTVIEWWGLMGVTVYSNGCPIGQKPVPFRIDASSRTEAFANLQKSMDAASESAKQQVADELDVASRKQRSKLVLAGAVPALRQ
jgi:hypothetical protein